MEVNDYRSIYEKAMSYIKPRRRSHVDGCITEAIRLSERWGADAERAAVAALLHDITKSEDADGQLKLCKKYGIIPRIIDQMAIGTIHASTGAAAARDLFGVDGEVQSAIRWHTTGRADMSLLEMIIYIADYIEPTRTFEGVEAVRDLAYRDLDRAMLTALKNTIGEICSGMKPISPETIEAYNYFLLKCNSKT